MMKKIWHLALIDIKIMVRDKIFFFWTLVFPLVFIFIFGNLYRGQGTTSQASLLVLNRDSGQWGTYFIEKIKSPGIRLEVVEAEPEKYNRILVIPPDFSEKLMERAAQALVFKKHANASVKAAAQVETRIIQAIAKVITELILHGDDDMSTFFEKKNPYRSIVTIKTQFPDNTLQTKPTGFDHVIPGVLVQFIMMMVLIYGGVSVMIDRQRGVLTRILFSSVSIPELWGGKFLGRLLMGILQALILVITGELFFGLNLGNYFLSLGTVLFFSIAIASLSIFIGSVLAKEDLIVGLSVLLANIFAALGGCWWPIEVVPSTIKTIGMISPAYWAMDAFHQIIFFHKGMGQIGLNFVILLLFTAVFTFLAVKFFKIRE
jgi:ABC-2 type transport system permease protein